MLRHCLRLQCLVGQQQQRHVGFALSNWGPRNSLLSKHQLWKLPLYLRGYKVIERGIHLKLSLKQKWQTRKKTFHCEGRFHVVYDVACRQGGIVLFRAPNEEHRWIQAGKASFLLFRHCCSAVFLWNRIETLLLLQLFCLKEKFLCSYRYDREWKNCCERKIVKWMNLRTTILQKL